MSQEGMADQDEFAGISLASLWGVLQMQRGVILGMLLLCVGVAVIVSVLTTRLYQARAVVHLAPQAAKEVQTEGIVTDVTAGWNRKIDVATKLAILESSGVLEDVVERYEAVRPDGPEVTVGKVRSFLDIEERKGTELIDILVTTPDPEQAAVLANLVAEVFRDEAQKANVEAIHSAEQWLAEQLQEYEERIRVATAALNDFERINGLAGSTSDGESSLDSRMTALNRELGEVSTDVVIQETLVADYERMLRQGRYEDLAKAMGSPLIGSLILRYADAVAERASVAAVYLPKMPERKKAEANVATIEAELRREVEKNLSAERAKLEILQAKRDTIVGAIGDGKSEILDLQSLWGEYEQRRLELSSARAFYERLRSRMGELELQAKTQFNRVRLLEAATPPSSHSYPVVSVNLAIGLILGLVSGFGIAFLREWLDDTVCSPVDVTAYLRTTFLGVIPKVEGEEDRREAALYTHSHPRSVVAESVRAVRTILELNPLAEFPRRLLVTSAVASEGKTSTAIRLAIAFASAHRRVVIVDCDLRRPRVHKVFGGERDGGLADLATGAAIDDVVRPTHIDGLSYVSAGRAGDRPGELLATPAASEALDALSEAFDMVIVDTPPSLLVADARLLSRHVDGVLLVARENSTPRSLLREALGGLHQVGAHVYGVVINAVDFNKSRTSYKYYGYGYNYNYSYDDSPNDAAAAK
jgi:capsular exopolysaccharide synthesis family protein